jgi:hypothetical protein
MYPPVPVHQKPLPPYSSHFWEQGNDAGNLWCECNVCLGKDHTVPRPKWIGMTG